MLSLEVLRTCVQYNDATNRRLWDAIMQISDEQFVAETDYSHGSIRNQMVHLAGVDGRWLRGLQELADARNFTPNPADYPTRASAFELWKTVSQDFLAYVDSLDEASLLYVPKGFSGPIWQVLLHVVNHGTDHRAQVLRLMHDQGAATFAQDLIFHLWFH